VQRGERGVDDRSRQQVVQLGMAYGPAAGLEILAGIGDHPRLVRWPQLHIARAELLSRLGRHEEARSAYRTALDLGPPPAERAYLERRIRRRP
jgi:RNA polymerase sigma-70 factor (ECF subfamily)